MFGLAIWDSRRSRLVLARDPFGIKLLYYRVERDSLDFGSEIRAVCAGAGKSAELDPLSLSLFLRYRYTPSPHTIFKGVQKLAPGTKLVAENGHCEVSRWYRFKPTPHATPRSARQAQDELLDIYQRAIRRHLISDVPVGLLLSGGLDSGLLLALMNGEGTRWATFTVGYGASFADDELADAEQTARSLGCQSHQRKNIEVNVRERATAYRRFPGGADCRFVHRPHVFCLREGAPGRQGCASRTGAG